MDNSNEQLPIILQEKKNSSEINKINESQNESPFDALSKTLKEMEQLINSIPTNEENSAIIESLQLKIALSQGQLSELQKSKTQNIEN